VKLGLGSAYRSASVTTTGKSQRMNGRPLALALPGVFALVVIAAAVLVLLRTC
jgi:hypothetical protein